MLKDEMLRGGKLDMGPHFALSLECEWDYIPERVTYLKYRLRM